MVPAPASASGTSSNAIAASRMPPPKAVSVAATRSGSRSSTAASAPASKLQAMARPQPTDDPRFVMGLSLPGWPAVGALGKCDRTRARDGFPPESTGARQAGLLLPHAVRRRKAAPTGALLL